jgi:hypothetical protein
MYLDNTAVCVECVMRRNVEWLVCVWCVEARSWWPCGRHSHAMRDVCSSCRTKWKRSTHSSTRSCSRQTALYNSSSFSSPHSIPSYRYLPYSTPSYRYLLYTTHHTGTSLTAHHHTGTSLTAHHHTGTSLIPHHDTGTSFIPHHHTGTSLTPHHHTGTSFTPHQHTAMTSQMQIPHTQVSSHTPLQHGICHNYRMR